MKQQTTDTYNVTADSMAEKFDKIGVRVDDVLLGFSLIEIKNPLNMALVNI